MPSNSENPAILNHLIQQYDDAQKKNDLLLLDIDNFYKYTNTNERKVYYEIEEISGLKNYNKWLKFFYFIILSVYIFTTFFGKEKYKTFSGWILLILYIIFPFILKYLVNGGFDLLYNKSNEESVNIGIERPQSTCLSDDDLDADDEEVDTSVQEDSGPPILIPKCYVRLEQGKCNNNAVNAWSGWNRQTGFPDCITCTGNTQSGCDDIKNEWSRFCGNNAFNIFTTEELPGNNTCFSN